MTDALNARAVLQAAAGQFNAHHFWESHETLEPLWLASAEPLKTCLQGLIQTAAGCVHIQRGNAKGAMSLLNAALTKLRAVRKTSDIDGLLNLDALITMVEQTKAEVERLGPADLRGFPADAFPRLTTR